MKPICFLVVFAVIFPYSLLFAQEESVEDTLTRISNKFFVWFETEEIKNIPKLFHFPTTSTPDVVVKDKKYIVASIGAFLREFGNISDKELASYQEPSQDFSIGADNIEYWQNYLDFERMVYKVSFSKAGEGYILFDFCKITAKWQIGFVRFALPVTNPKADQMLSNIGKIIWQLKE